MSGAPLLNASKEHEPHMTRFSRLSLAATVALTLASTGAQAQMLGIFNGVTSVFSQVTGKIGNKITGGESAKDIQAERDKFFTNMEAQTAGMDPAAKTQLAATMEKSWGLAENAILMSNAQAQRAKDAPLIDFKQVAKDSMGGFSTGIGMASVFGNAGGIGDIMRSASMDGLVDGMGGDSNASGAMVNRLSAPAMAGKDVSAATSNGITAGVTGGAAATVRHSVGGAVSGLVGKLGFGKHAVTFEATDSVNPLTFFGKHPSELAAKDLYRENGFMGWKRIDSSADLGAEAYAPLAGDEHVKAAVFNYDKTTKQVNVAFRVLTVPITEFNKVVELMGAKFGEQPRYASTGSVQRAVWSSGAFVAADTTKISLGWSHLVPAIYAAAAQTPVASN